MTNPPRRFYLDRTTDVTGVSGPGHVADGILWPDGTVSIRWTGDRPSIVHWGSLADAEYVHGHVGATRFVWLDPEGDHPDAEAQVRGAQAWMADDLHAALGHRVDPDQPHQGHASWGDQWAALTGEIRELRRARDAADLDTKEADGQ